MVCVDPGETSRLGAADAAAVPASEAWGGGRVIASASKYRAAVPAVP